MTAPRYLCGGLLAPLLLALPALAAAADQAGPADMAPGIGTSVVKMLIGLSLVLALMVFLYWLMRRFLPGGAALGGGRIRILGRLALGARKSVTLIEVAGQVLVLGVGNDSISLLDKVDDPERVAELTAGAGAFARALKRAGGKEEKA